MLLTMIRSRSVDRRFGELGDVTDRDCVETVLLKQLLGSTHDALASLTLLTFHEGWVSAHDVTSSGVSVAGCADPGRCVAALVLPGPEQCVRPGFVSWRRAATPDTTGIRPRCWAGVESTLLCSTEDPGPP